jgi:pectin methylesterase-like acyl-CoA thioesterase
MFIPGPKLNTLFASRWKALLWAGGVLLTAYCTVPSAEETNSEDSAASHTASKPATSPWAPDPTPAHQAQ